MKAHRLLPLIPAVALVGSGWFANRLEIGRQAKIPVVLTHHKAVGRHGWGKSVLTLAMVDSARRAGTDVMIDQYPYTASYTGLDVLVPPWALAGGSEALRGRLANPALRDSIRRGVLDLILNDRGGADLKRVQFARVGWDPSLQGKTLADWAVRRGLPPPETGIDLALEGVLKGEAGMVFHVIDEADVQRIMAHPQTMIASDGEPRSERSPTPITIRPGSPGSSSTVSRLLPTAP